MNDLEKLNHAKLTENGDLAFDTTGSKLLDLFFMSAYFEKHLDEVKIGNSDIEQLFSMFMRDPRLGLGRRDLGRELMKQSETSPEHVVLAGRFDDLLSNPTDTAIAYWRAQIEAGNELAKKWAPRLTGKNSKFAKLLAKTWKMTQKQYRNFIKCDSTVEYKLSYIEKAEAGTLFAAFGDVAHPLVDEIDFEKLPSLALMKYTHAFATREDTKDRFSQYLFDVKEGKKKLNVSVVNVYDIYKNDDIDRDLYFDKIEKIQINCLPIVDTSGSMTVNDAIGKALSIGHYLAKCSTYMPNYAVTFSSKPQLVELGKTKACTSYWGGRPILCKGDSNYAKEINSMYCGDCTNTDLSAVMNGLTKLYGEKNVPQYLVILSDMEFDDGSSDSKDYTMQYFKSHGWNTKIVWWNFNDRNKTVPETDEYGNIFLSGYSPQLLQFLQAGFDGNAFLRKLLYEYACKLDK